MNFLDRLQHGWNAFRNRDPTTSSNAYYGNSSYRRPDIRRLSRGNERSIANSVFNRIALDVSSITIKHCQLDENGRYLEEIKSGLNNCLNVEANIDQTSRSFIQDVVMSMLDEGVVAIVPVDTTLNPNVTGSYDITSMRTGKIVEWYPKHVKVRLYNDTTGEKQEIILSKKTVCIIENPLRSVINEPNSTMQRLIKKLSLMDTTDEQLASGKLDLIISLPYAIKTDARRKEAEARRKDIEMQLTENKYGIAYTDGTEKITQLNRSLENNLMKQVEYLTELFFSQLGVTKAVLDGSADEKTMLNYYGRTIEPIVSAIVDEMKRKFLTKTAISQNKSIEFFRDPFKLVPIDNIANVADTLARNEIMTSNEIRQVLGLKPSTDPKADMLMNSNLNHDPEEGQGVYEENPEVPEEYPEDSQ